MEDTVNVSDLYKMNLMVENFRQLCCARAVTNQTCLPDRRFTKFTVDEILKPKFGIASHEKCGYDSDGTYFSDNAVDVYSSGDECFDSDVSCGADGVVPTSSTSYGRKYYDQLEDLSHRSRTTQSLYDGRTEEDGYTSSDSETALDLRIERKKTPPKITNQLPAWVFCTRYSDRPSAGPRTRRRKPGAAAQRRNRTAFNEFQLHQMNQEFVRDPYLTEERRLRLAQDLNLHEASIKVWFQNRRAKEKKESGIPQALAQRLRKEGLYNHKAAVDTVVNC